ncbi:hypothetical protein HY008_02735 [Candidatus Woesebacteria bacterium]|nr:hypothetical protein [Candidatus Woesebacteria bacterium]
MKRQKGFAPVIILLAVLVIAGLGGAYYFATHVNKSTQPQPTIQPSPTLASKADVNREPSGSGETVNWKTYTDSNLNYSFQYPPPSCELQRFAGDTSFAICYLPKGSDGGSKHNNGYVISLGFISKSQLSVMGVTYCGAYPNDSSRCELFNMGKVTASIDWGTGGDASASILIGHPNGGIVTFTLQPVMAESKAILKQILSTFRFD